VRVGVISFVRELLAGDVIPGARGAVVSIVKVVARDGVVLFAASVRVTLYVFEPSGSEVVGVKL
jgi:hypothetical protein